MVVPRVLEAAILAVEADPWRHCYPVRAVQTCTLRSPGPVEDRTSSGPISISSLILTCDAEGPGTIRGHCLGLYWLQDPCHRTVSKKTRT